MQFAIVPLELPLELVQPPAKFGMGGEDGAEPHEHADDADGYLNRARAAENARQHRDTLLREDIRQVPTPAAALL